MEHSSSRAHIFVGVVIQFIKALVRHPVGQRPIGSSFILLLVHQLIIKDLITRSLRRFAPQDDGWGLAPFMTCIRHSEPL
jgi:hypothetical protein